MKTIQRKRYHADQVDSSALNSTQIVEAMEFVDAPAVNIHGVNISLGVAPTDPDETMRGRWYVVVLPRSVAQDSTIRTAWIGELDTQSDAKQALDGSNMVWGSGSFVASQDTPFNHSFAPKTSRNIQMEGQLLVLIVADSITGLLDFWEANATIALFTTS